MCCSGRSTELSNGRGTRSPSDPPVTDAQLWNTRSRMRTRAMETMTKEAPRTRNEAMPMGTASSATATAPSTSATQGLMPVCVVSSATAYPPRPE